MELTNDEIWYLLGLINQQLEDCKWTLTSKEFNWRFDLKSKLQAETKTQASAKQKSANTG